MNIQTKLIAGAALAITAVLVHPGASQAAPAWAPAETATIHPGVMMNSPAGQCTANFIFFDASNVYIGFAAHCVGTGAATDTNGCDAGSLPLGTAVQIDGASQAGTLVYSSWLAMQQAGEANPDTCDFNDFAVVRIAAADANKVNPSIPVWGGPTGLDPNGAGTLESVYSYGNSSLRGGIEQFSPKTGYNLQEQGSGWSHNVFTVTPGVPGDSGSAFLSSSGQALGVLVTLQIAPLAGSNGVTDLSHALAYAQSHGLAGLQLATGTEPFDGSPLGLLGL